MLNVPMQELLIAAMFVMDVMEDKSVGMLEACVFPSCCCCFTDEPVGWQGLPSRTKTGTATLRGEGRGVMSKPFSCLALFVLYLWFWNQILTCVGVKRMMLAKCSLSGAERYLCCRNLKFRKYFNVFFVF